MEDSDTRGRAFLEYSLEGEDELYSPDDRQERGHRLLSDQMEQLKLAVHKIDLVSSKVDALSREVSKNLSTSKERRDPSDSLTDSDWANAQVKEGEGEEEEWRRIGRGVRKGGRGREGEEMERRRRRRSMTMSKATSGFVSSTEMGSSLKNKSTTGSLFAGKEIVSDIAAERAASRAADMGGGAEPVQGAPKCTPSTTSRTQFLCLQPQSRHPQPPLTCRQRSRSRRSWRRTWRAAEEGVTIRQPPRQRRVCLGESAAAARPDSRRPADRQGRDQRDITLGKAEGAGVVLAPALAGDGALTRDEG
eukprot:768340-Hanusia_phi.AAC.5